MSLGPVQVLVIAVEDDDLGEAIAAKIRRLADNETVGLIDFLVVTRDAAGVISGAPREVPILGLGGDTGTLITALIGIEADEGGDGFADSGWETVLAVDGTLSDQAGGWFLADAIPLSTTAAIVLVEHRWAAPLRDLGTGIGARTLFDRWLHPRDLAAIGADRPPSG